MEKGYDNTTIRTLWTSWAGLTKGAVYHHFKSKEEILDKVSDRMFFQNNPFEAVEQRGDLNGLEKLRGGRALNQADASRTNLTLQSLALDINPRLLVEMMDSTGASSPPLLELLEEGNRDGSLHTEYPPEIAELLPVLTSLWLMPSLFPPPRRR